MPLSQELLAAAQHCASIERNYRTDNLERIRAISFALFDVIDIALLDQVITVESESLPHELECILSDVYSFLGDPLP